MFKTLANAWKVEDIKKKIIFTLFIILIYRIGANIVIPFINYGAIEQYEQSMQGFWGTLMGAGLPTQNFGLLNIMGGTSFSQATLFALGVSPYITSSIVMQLLAVAIPALERMGRSEEGKKKITSITRYVTIVLAIIMGLGYYVLLDARYGVVMEAASKGYKFFYAVVIVACLVAGSSLVMWLAEKINDKGLGNGVSMILFANIVSRAPAMLDSIIKVFNAAADKTSNGKSYLVAAIIYVVGMSLLIVFLIWFIIFISDSERRIPVQYAKKVVGRKMYGGQNTNLPIKINMAGVMPVIFASSILSIPSMIGQFVTNPSKFWKGFFNQFQGAEITNILLTLVLIFAFAYFYISISFNPTEVAVNLQKNGGSIPGIRPGRATADFIKKVLSKITFIGAISLAVIAVVPMLIQYIVDFFNPYYYQWGEGYGSPILYVSDFIQSGTSIIIVVGVILETLRELETQMSMRHYKGFLE